MSSTRLMRN